MKLLAWDTSSKTGALVALEWDPSDRRWESVRLRAELTLNVDTAHSEQLLWGIHQVLESTRWKLNEVDLLGVGLGPGSFTGLRIGITTARTLAQTLEKPLIGVSSLAALARPAALFSQSSGSETLVVCTTDACKGELFALWGEAEKVRNCVLTGDRENLGLWDPEVYERVLTPNDLVHQLHALLQEKQEMKWLALGEGSKRYAEAWARLPASRKESHGIPFANAIQGRFLGMLIWEAYQADCLSREMALLPRYLRASDAELKLKAGLLSQPCRKIFLDA